MSISSCFGGLLSRLMMIVSISDIGTAIISGSMDGHGSVGSSSALPVRYWHIPIDVAVFL